MAQYQRIPTSWDDSEFADEADVASRGMWLFSFSLSPLRHLHFVIEFVRDRSEHALEKSEATVINSRNNSQKIRI